MKSPIQYREDLESYLGSYTPVLIPKLVECLKLTLADDVAFLDFEVFEDSAAGEFRVMFAPTTRENDVYCEYRNVLNTKDFALPESLDACGYSFDYDREEDGFIKVFASWFQICWVAAGGIDHSLPAYVCSHDDIRSFDLAHCLWIDDNKKFNEK